MLKKNRAYDSFVDLNEDLRKKRKGNRKVRQAVQQLKALRFFGSLP